MHNPPIYAGTLKLNRFLKNLIAACIHRYVVTLGFRSKYDVMVTILYLQYKSLLILVNCYVLYYIVNMTSWSDCYDVLLLCYIPQLYFLCNRLIIYKTLK